jgi:protein O-GlcNAc transferase
MLKEDAAEGNRAGAADAGIVSRSHEAGSDEPDGRWAERRNCDNAACLRSQPTAMFPPRAHRRCWVHRLKPMTTRSSPFNHDPPASSAATALAETLQRAIALHQAGHVAQAELLYRSLLRTAPEHFDALRLLGVAAMQGGRAVEAGELLASALVINPHHPETLYNHGLALARVGRHNEALARYDAALALRPDFVNALSDRGVALFALARHDEAAASYDRALAIDARNVAALYNRSGALLALQRFPEAIASCDAALVIAPELAPALNNRASALIQQKRYDEALASLDRALLLQPDFGEALYNRGSALADMRRHDEAARDFARAFALDPDLPLIEALLLHSRMHCCDWQTFETQSERLIAGVQAGRLASDPLTLLAISDSPVDQLQCGKAWVRNKGQPSSLPLWKGERYAHERIRVAYLSADLREHPVAYLMAELFERHDRGRFETAAVSFGSAAPSAMRDRLQRAFDRFLDVREMSDREVAQRLRAMEIDIAVDLMGITAGARTGILAQRPAPVQVSYLGFPGSMGADYIDYLIADRYLIAEDRRQHYAEQVVYLPDTFQATDATRTLAAAPARGALGLPERGLVFCSFNNSYKITPALFGVWMRLLQGVAGSVLWLVGNAVVEANLKREAVGWGVDPGRLVFAPRVGYAEHLARCAAADLFLDTLPFNAGTTASDALWAGLPLLTCSGEAFAARMAGSLLHAVGLPELVTTTLAEYEARALALAREPRLLAEVRERLARNRHSAPLFDSDRFRRHLEAAYIGMWERQRRGEPPAAFAVATVV